MDEEPRNCIGKTTKSRVMVSKLKVTELRKALASRNLPTAGLKGELCERLQEALDNEGRGDQLDEISESKSPQFSYEFGGPIGAAGVMIGLPSVMYLLYFTCGGFNDGWCLASPHPSDLEKLRAYGTNFSNNVAGQFLSWRAAGILLAWLAFQIGLERFLPGDDVDGVLLKDGSRLKYRMNGHLAFWVSLLVAGFCYPTWTVATQDSDCNKNEATCSSNISGGLDFPLFGRFPLEVLYDEYLALIGASVAFSFVLSFYLYVTSFSRGALLADGGVSGNIIYDFFIGRELNPRIGSFDLKCFCELRPGLIGWCILNLGMAAKQAKLNNGVISPSMILVNLFQGLYVWDALFHERAILTTMDITTDGFGFMLAFGDLAWVPFTYTLQARYLVEHDPGLSLYALLGISIMTCCGYRIFRGANSQKDAFRRDPNAPEVSHLKYMSTKRGTKLLLSGFWGMARKINYTGDWLMGMGWCMFCGTESIIPYFYAIYFGVLLVHRAFRDDGLCMEKYGGDWLEYKKKVPYMFIPGLF